MLKLQYTIQVSPSRCTKYRIPSSAQPSDLSNRIIGPSHQEFLPTHRLAYRSDFKVEVKKWNRISKMNEYHSDQKTEVRDKLVVSCLSSCLQTPFESLFIQCLLNLCLGRDKVWERPWSLFTVSAFRPYHSHHPVVDHPVVSNHCMDFLASYNKISNRSRVSFGYKRVV